MARGIGSGRRLGGLFDNNGELVDSIKGCQEIDTCETPGLRLENVTPVSSRCDQQAISKDEFLGS